MVIAGVSDNCLWITSTNGTLEIYKDGKYKIGNFSETYYPAVNLYDSVVLFLAYNLPIEEFKVEKVDKEGYTLVASNAKIIKQRKGFYISWGEVLFSFVLGLGVLVSVANKHFVEKIDLKYEQIIDEVLRGIVYKDGSFVYDGKEAQIISGEVGILKVGGNKLEYGNFAVVEGKLLSHYGLIDWILGFCAEFDKLETCARDLVLSNENCDLILRLHNGEVEDIAVSVRVESLEVSLLPYEVAVIYSGNGKFLSLHNYLDGIVVQEFVGEVLSNKMVKALIF